MIITIDQVINIITIIAIGFLGYICITDKF